MTVDGATTRLRYPKPARLCARREIDRVFREGRYCRLGILHAKVLTSDHPRSRFLISIKRKIGKAHARIRIKRLVREAIRLNRARLQGAHDICLFLTAAPPATLRLPAVELELRKLFRRLNETPRAGSQG